MLLAHIFKTFLEWFIYLRFENVFQVDKLVWTKRIRHLTSVIANHVDQSWGQSSFMQVAIESRAVYLQNLNPTHYPASDLPLLSESCVVLSEFKLCAHKSLLPDLSTANTSKLVQKSPPESCASAREGQSTC